MNLLIENTARDICVIKPVISGEQNIESVIARVKMFIMESPQKHKLLDLTAVNFLDCIKIGTIIGTYHFLEFSERKIYILVSYNEVKNALERLSFNNIEIYTDNRLALEDIA